MSYRYEISRKNEIRIWDLDNPNEINAPFLYQPNWPDGTDWANKEEAEGWTQIFIESLENPDSEFIVGGSPENHPQPRPLPDTETIK